MPNGKRKRRPRPRRERGGFDFVSCAEQLRRKFAPLFRARIPTGTRSAAHLRNAAIEFMEAMRAFLEEAIEWLRKSRPAELKRIRVE